MNPLTNGINRLLNHRTVLAPGVNIPKGVVAIRKSCACVAKALTNLVHANRIIPRTGRDSYKKLNRDNWPIEAAARSAASNAACRANN